MKYEYVKDLMTSPAIYCDEEASISSVIDIFKSYNIGFLPITKSNILVGVVTDRDVLIRGISKNPIKDIMTSGEIEFVNPTTTLIEAATIMAKKKIRRLVVVDDGKVIGVLTTKNLLKEPSLLNYIVETYKNNDTLKEYAMYENSNPHDSIKTSDYPL